MNDEDVNKIKSPESSDTQSDNENSFSGINERESPYSDLLKRRKKHTERKSAEELKIIEKLEAAKKLRPGLNKAILKTASNVYGYTNIDELLPDLPKLRTGELRGRPNLYKTKEEYEQGKDTLEELFKTDKNLVRRVERREDQIIRLKERQDIVAQKNFSSGIQRELTELPIKTNVLSRESDTSIAASIEVEKKPLFDYNKQRKEKQKEQELLRRQLSAVAQDIDYIRSPEGEEQFQQISEELETKTKETAKSLALERSQKRSKKDLESQFERVSSTVGKEQERLGSEQLKKEISEGKHTSLPKEMGELEKVSTALTKALEKMKDEIDKTGTATETLREEVEKAEVAFEKQKKLVDVMKKEGIGGGGSKFESFQRVMNAAVVGADAVRYGIITSEIQQRQARASTAEIVNQEYSDYRAAAKFDVGASRRLTEKRDGKSFWDMSREDFVEGKGRESKVLFTEAGTNTAAGSAEAVTEAGGGSALNLINPVNIGKGVLKAAPHLAQTSKLWVDYSKENTATMSGIQMQQGRRAVDDATQKQRDINTQEAMNYGLQMFESIQGFGAEAGSKTFDAFTSSEARKKFRDLGLSPTEIPNLVGQAGQMIGAAFTEAPISKQLEITQKAQAADQARIMSSSQYLGNLGQLTQAGGGSKQLEEIMANAVARGVGNAKNITDITNLVSGISAKSGTTVASGTTAMITRTMDALNGLMPGEQYEGLRKQRAIEAQEKVNQSVTSTGMDYTSVMQMARMSQKFGHISSAGRIVAQRDVDFKTINTIEDLEKRIKTGDKDAEGELDSLLKQKGISEFYNKGGKRLTGKESESVTAGLREIKAYNVTDRLAAFSPEIVKEVNEYIMSGGKTKPSNESRSAIASVFPNISIEELGGVAGTAEIKKKEVSTKTTGGAEGMRRSKIAGAGTEEKIIEQGLNNAGGSTEQAFANLATKFEESFKNFNPEDMQIKAVQAAEKMNLNFDKSIGTFDKAVDKLVEAIKLLPVSTNIDRALSAKSDNRNKYLKPDEAVNSMMRK